MAYASTITDGRLHSVMDPNGGTLYKDTGSTVPATAHGDAILRNKDANGVIASKVNSTINSQSLTLSIVNSIKSLRLTSNSNGQQGVGLDWTTGTLDPGHCTIIIAHLPDRVYRSIDDTLADPGRSTTGSITQWVHDSGIFKTYNNAALSSVPSPLLGDAVAKPAVVAMRCNGTGTTFWRSDIYGSSGFPSGLVASFVARIITSAPSTVGWILGAKGSLNANFYQGNIYLALAFNGDLSDAEIQAEISNVITYLQTFGLFTYSSTAPRLITIGDSNCACISNTVSTNNWGYLLQQGLITDGVTGLEYFNTGIANYTFAQIQSNAKCVADLINGTSGRSVLVIHCGENDMNVSAASTVYTNAKAAISAIRTLVTNLNNLKIIWLGWPARSASNQTNYDTNRTNLRTSVLAAGAFADLGIDAFVDLVTDSVLGPSGVPSGANTSFDSGDHTHYTNTGSARVYNGTDGSYGTTLKATAKNLFATARRGAFPRGMNRGMDRAGV